MLDPTLTAAFCDELEKIAIARGRMKVTNDRKGRRPIHVDTLLKKEKDGTLYKSTGSDHKIAQVQPFLAGQVSPADVRPSKRKGDLPSREELEAVPKRGDGRDNAATVLGPGNFLVAPGIGGAERAE